MTTDRLPLSALLSQTLVAFTVEFDNEFEHQMPHRTSRNPRPGPRGRPWLVSQAMWSNFMRYLPADGLPLGQLGDLAGLVNLNGLLRWRYLEVLPDPGPRIDRRLPDQLIRPSAAGRAAQRIWAPLGATIHERWSGRFGQETIATLVTALSALADRIGRTLPDYLPVIAPTQGGMLRLPEHLDRPEPVDDSSAPDLSVLLSHVLLAFTDECERTAPISLPIGANTLRVLGDDGIRVRDLPVLTGVSKEANATAIGFLERQGWVTQEVDRSGTRGKVVLLTSKGRVVRRQFIDRVGNTEEEWIARHGSGELPVLRSGLESLAATDAATGSPRLWTALTPYPDGWRASVSEPKVLPQYPMVLHRGGYPDGS